MLGQTVSIETTNGTGLWKVGEHVAVFGLRRPDGVIVASLIERRAGGPDKVAGRMLRLRDGSFRIGRLRLTGVDPALAGTRVVVEGAHKAGVLAVANTTRERDLLNSGIRRFAIESYVERTRTGLRLGSGIDVTGKVPQALPAGSYALAVVTAVADGQGSLGLEKISFEGPPVRSDGPRQGPASGTSPGASVNPGGHKAAPIAPDAIPARPSPDGAPPDAAHGRNTGNGSGAGSGGRGRGSGSDQGSSNAGGSGRGSGDGGGSHGGGSAGGNGGGNGNGNGRGSDNAGQNGARL